MDSNNPLLAEYLDRPAFAKALGYTSRTLERWESKGIGPPVTRIGRKPYYRVAGVQEWLRSREKPMVREGARKRAGKAA